MNSKYFSFRTLLLGITLLVGAFFIYQWIPSTTTIDFSTQVKPILNKKCIACHGGVKKSGGVSFLFREEMITEGESGKMAVVPGKASQSEVIRRINHPDPEIRMPPEGDALSQAEVDILTKWIEQGAEWGEHWAYQPVKNPDIPPYPLASGEVDQQAKQWGNNDIDRFVIKKLVELNLTPNEVADCATLARRLSLDLTGLPPSPEMVTQYCADPSEAAYQSMVDTLLASPTFGEHWAAHWLDLARYADTKGFERDGHREIWHYRDWLIKSFNQDQGFDQFTIEQLAGDLLPNPSPDQYTATAFHRNTMSNDEGGTDNEEYRVQAIMDRVNTTWGVWLGTTMNCVQCHSHPYDPIRHEDFYTSYAYFNNSRDEDTFQDMPRFRLYHDADSVKVDSIKAYIRGLAFADEQSREESVEQFAQLVRTTEPKVHPHYFEFLENSAHSDTKHLQFYPNGLVKLPQFKIGKDSLLLISFNGVPNNGFLEIRGGSKDGPLVQSIPLQKDYSWKRQFFTLSALAETTDLYFSYLPGTDAKANLSISWMVFLEPPFAAFASIQGAVSELLNAPKVASVPVMMEGRGQYERTTQIFERGNWLTHGDTVQTGVPNIFASSYEGTESNRLALAKWIIHPDNPLTARVTVNRFWEQLFGRGIVETSEDFGSQGSLPTHPELLDHLAYQFVHEQAWSVKSLLKTLVSSATYQQSSNVSKTKLEKDPYNQFLSRGPRVRLSAEQVRDQTLAVSGLLTPKMYGPPVMPPQPDGVWSVIYNGAQWVPSSGEDRYRRAVYTYWRRTSPYPSMISFDAPSREVCVIRRIRTNTPLQALVSLNDPVYLEAAQAMARRITSEHTGIEDGIQAAYKQAIFKSPSTTELEELKNIYTEALRVYGPDPVATREMLTPQDQLLFKNVVLDSDAPDCEDGDCARLAAMTVVSNVILNLDAFITKE